jgi:hypothetical protein
MTNGFRFVKRFAFSFIKANKCSFSITRFCSFSICYQYSHDQYLICWLYGKEDNLSYIRFWVFTALTMKNAVFWDVTRGTIIGELRTTLAVTSKRSMLRRNVPSSQILATWYWRLYVSPTRWLLKEPHGVASQKTAFISMIFRRLKNYRGSFHRPSIPSTEGLPLSIVWCYVVIPFSFPISLLCLWLPSSSLANVEARWSGNTVAGCVGGGELWSYGWCDSVASCWWLGGGHQFRLANRGVKRPYVL